MALLLAFEQKAKIFIVMSASDKQFQLLFQFQFLIQFQLELQFEL